MCDNFATAPEPPPSPGAVDIFPLALADLEAKGYYLVARDIKDRAKMGVKKYGMPLRSNNGRDALVDGYQELLDAISYFRQGIEEKGDSIILLIIYQGVIDLAASTRKLIEEKNTNA